MQLSAADGAHEAEDVEVEVLGLPDEVGRMKDLATARAARRETSGKRIEPVTFTFSEAPVGFTASDLTAANGIVSALTATANPLVFTATFTATRAVIS